jgi:hypothetical protein
MYDCRNIPAYDLKNSDSQPITANDNYCIDSEPLHPRYRKMKGSPHKRTLLSPGLKQLFTHK